MTQLLVMYILLICILLFPEKFQLVELILELIDLEVDLVNQVIEVSRAGGQVGSLATGFPVRSLRKMRNLVIFICIYVE